MNEEPTRLKIPADLQREVQELTEQLTPDHKGPVTVSVGKSGKVRRNSVCPCGSGRKYKKCCMDDVTMGNLPLIRAHGSSKRIPGRYDPPRKLSKYSSEYQPPDEGPRE